MYIGEMSAIVIAVAPAAVREGGEKSNLTGILEVFATGALALKQLHTIALVAKYKRNFFIKVVLVRNDLLFQM
jgi:hypothetical protein